MSGSRERFRAALAKAAGAVAREVPGVARRKHPKLEQFDRNLEFERMLRAHGIGGWVREHRFRLPDRQSRFDFAWIPQKFAVEIDGAIFTGGRHVHPTGLRSDYEKMQAALDLGWVVFRIYPDLIQRESTIATVRRYVGDGGPMPPVQRGLKLGG